jgi:hypothetical protein
LGGSGEEKFKAQKGYGMTDALKDLIARDEWLEVAKLITYAYVDAPVNPKKYAWVSAVEEGPYHIETNDSAAKGGDTFRSLCGVAGPFNAHKLPAQIFPSQKCKSCVEISGKQVLDVVPQGTTGGFPVKMPAEVIDMVNQTNSEAASEVVDQGKATSVRIDSLCVGNGGGCPSHSPLYLPTPEPSHFSKSVDHFSQLVAKKLAEQNSVDLEEEAAAEEGAAIEASGYNDPATDRRFA